MFVNIHDIDYSLKMWLKIGVKLKSSIQFHLINYSSILFIYTYARYHKFIILSLIVLKMKYASILITQLFNCIIQSSMSWHKCGNGNKYSLWHINFQKITTYVLKLWISSPIINWWEFSLRNNVTKSIKINWRIFHFSHTY